MKNVKRGKEVFYSMTAKGIQVCTRCYEIREACLMPGFKGSDAEKKILHDSAALLRELSGCFDLAARAAISMSFVDAGENISAETVDSTSEGE